MAHRPELDREDSRLRTVQLSSCLSLLTWANVPLFTAQIALSQARDAYEMVNSGIEWRPHESLLICDAVVRVLTDPGQTLELLMDAEEVDSARRALRTHYGFDEEQARAATDIQFRQVTKLDRTRISERQQVLAERLSYLTSLAGQGN